jgi:hypothetical protein
MWDNTNSTYGQAERNRRRARESENNRNFILGLILFPILIAGWMPILWIISKFIK